jgi:hypothetical protein
MTHRIVRVALGFLVLAAVGSLQGGDVPKFAMSDADVLKVITQGPRVPKGFYSEVPKAGPKEVVTLNWVRRLKEDGRRVVPVYANSLAIAKAMAFDFQAKAKVPAEARQIQDEEETPTYYQIKTKHKKDNTTFWTYHRVWRGDFFQPGDDLGSRYLGENGTYKIGKLTGKRDEATVRRLAELLWWNDYQNLPGAYMLAPPKSWDDRSSFKVTMFMAQVVKGDSGVPDTVHVIRWELAVGRDSGMVSQTIKGLRRVKGKRASGGG